MHTRKRAGYRPTMSGNKTTKKPSAKKRARHTANLNRKRQRREDKVILDEMKLGWQDLLVLWSDKNLTKIAASTLKKLVENGRIAKKIDSFPDFVIQELAQKGLIAQSEGFFTVSKISKLKQLGIIAH